MSRSALLKSALNTEISTDLSPLLQNYACVSLLLREKNQELELAFIRRAIDPNDKWSGQLAFPGGRKDPEDSSDLATAIRETKEEIGYDIQANFCLGRLHDVQARHRLGTLPFFLRSFVFFLEQDQKVTLQEKEVADFFWMPLSYLLDPAQHTDFHLQIQDGSNHTKNLTSEPNLKLPAIRFPQEPVLWGLSYMILTDFVHRLAKSPHKFEGLNLSSEFDLNFWKKYI